jgi:hypothetical protein
LLWPEEDRITRKNFDRIAKGMSAGEVQVILGPPGDYTTGPVCLRIGTCDLEEERSVFDDHWTLSDAVLQEWSTDTDKIWVFYSQAGVIQEARHHTWTPCERDRISRLRSLQWQAKRQWHRWFPE